MFLRVPEFGKERAEVRETIQRPGLEPHTRVIGKFYKLPRYRLDLFLFNLFSQNLLRAIGQEHFQDFLDIVIQADHLNSTCIDVKYSHDNAFDPSMHVEPCIQDAMDSFRRREVRALLWEFEHLDRISEKLQRLTAIIDAKLYGDKWNRALVIYRSLLQRIDRFPRDHMRKISSFLKSVTGTSWHRVIEPLYWASIKPILDEVRRSLGCNTADGQTCFYAVREILKHVSEGGEEFEPAGRHAQELLQGFEREADGACFRNKFRELSNWFRTQRARMPVLVREDGSTDRRGEGDLIASISSWTESMKLHCVHSGDDNHIGFRRHYGIHPDEDVKDLLYKLGENNDNYLKHIHYKSQHNVLVYLPLIDVPEEFVADCARQV